jgi:transposase-like protein
MSELRLAVLVECERTGETVAEICRRYGISRHGFHQMLARVKAA